MGCDFDEAIPAGHGNISIHAPAWGATILSLKYSAETTPFQSTHPHGVRLDNVQMVAQERLISIHAPAWGATTENTWS